jgi:putative tricarboxylic transport membrane protein
MFMRLVYLLLTLIPVCALAQGAGWKPDRPVELIIGAAPGGANDRIGRALQRGLQDGKFANPVVVMNKPGGGTAVTLRDVTPVIKILDEYQVYFVRNDSPIRTAKDIVDRLKKDPGSVSFGFSTATGNPLHISIATFGRLAGVDPAKLTTVVYESGTNTAIQVAGGHLDVGVQSPGSAWQLAQAGKIRLLAVAGPNRLPGELANVPTLREQGINSDANVFYTLFAPKGIDSAQVAWWDRSLSSVMQSEQIRKDSEFNRWTLDPIGHRELPAFLEREHENYRRALAELGLQK